MRRTSCFLAAFALLSAGCTDKGAASDAASTTDGRVARSDAGADTAATRGDAAQDLAAPGDARVVQTDTRPLDAFPVNTDTPHSDAPASDTRPADTAPLDTRPIDRATPDANADKATPDATAPDGLFLNGFFPIGAFAVPASHFAKWKKRGLNTMVEEALEGGDDLASWSRAVQAAGLKMIRAPLANPADDIGNTALIAWTQPDEPDAYGKGREKLPELRQNYAQWKRADPTRPVYINFGGSDVMSASTPGDIATYKDMMKTGDWIANDRYPVSGYLNEPDRRYDLTLLGEPIDRLRSWDPAKPQFCYIESANFSGGSARGVKADEIRAQMWLAIVHGVRGIVFFSHVFNSSGWAGWDGTPDAVAAEMTAQNAIITSLASVLQGEIDPASIGATVPMGLQVAWRDAPTGKYFIVVNPTGSARSNQAITLNGTSGATTATVFGESRTVPVTDGGGTITDSFGAFAVHIYVVN